MNAWYYADESRQQHGPVDAAAMRDLFAAGRIWPATLVWREGLSRWQALADFSRELDLATAPAADAAVVAGSAGGEQPPTGRAVFSAREPAHGQYEAPRLVEPVAAVAPPPADTSFAHDYAVAGDAPGDAVAPASPYAAPQASVAASLRAVHGGEVVQAGFWKRVAAYFIDNFLLAIAGMVLGGLLGAVLSVVAAGALNTVGTSFFIIQGVSTLVQFGLYASYFAWFHASSSQATPGKMAVGIKVVRSNGEAITFWRGFARYFAQILSGLLLFIGYLMVAFTARKQALHDLMCDTLVVDRWAFTHQADSQRRELGAVTWVVLIIGGLVAAFVASAFGLAMLAMAGIYGR